MDDPFYNSSFNCGNNMNSSQLSMNSITKMSKSRCWDNNPNFTGTKRIKEKSRAMEKAQRENEAKNCTFKPIINKRSKLLAKKTEAGENLHLSKSPIEVKLSEREK